MNLKYLPLLLCLFCARIVSAQETADTLFPKPIGWVNDFENILDAETEAILTKLIDKHEKKTTNQISVITISSIAPYDSFETYAMALSNNWGVGTKEKDNGLTIVFSKTFREVRISTGYGLEKKLTDVQCKKIIDELMIPSFKKGDYSKGVMDAVKEIIRILETSE